MKEIKKYMFSSGMLITLAVSALFPFVSNLKLIRYGRFLENLKLVYRGQFFISTFWSSGLFIPMLVGLPAVALICVEQSSGYYKNILMRKSKNKYIIHTLLGVMLVSGIGVALPGVFTGIVAMFGRPYMGHEAYSMMNAVGWMEKYSTGLKGSAPILIYIFTMFIFGCVWGIYALIFSVLFKNIYVTLAAPFFTTLVIQILFDHLKLEKYAPMNMLGSECLAIPSMSYAMIYQFIFFVVFSLIYYFVSIRRLGNE